MIGHSNPVQSLASLTLNQGKPDEKLYLFSGSSQTNCSIKVWDVNTGTCLKTFKGHSQTISCILVLTPDLIASSSYDCSIKIWSIKLGTVQYTLNQHTLAILNLSHLQKKKKKKKKLNTQAF